MAVNRIQRHSRGAASYSGNASGFAVDSDTNQLVLNVDGVQRPVATSAVKILTAAHTATAAESGTLFILDSTTAITVTLPATVSGLQYSFALKQLPSSGTHAISPNSADKIFGPGITAADDKDIQASATADTIGDTLTLRGDGVDGWFIISVGEGTADNWTRQT